MTMQDFEDTQKAAFDEFFKKSQKVKSYAADYEFFKIIEMMGDISEKSILDLGCGDGRLSLRLARRAGKVVGYDISSEGVNKANVEAAEVGLSNFVAEVNSFENPDANKFDIVLCVNFLHHTPNQDVMLANIYKSLKPEGKLIVIENNPLNPLFLIYFVVLGQLRIHLTKPYLRVNRFSFRKSLLKNNFNYLTFDRYAFFPTNLYNKFKFFISINQFLNKIPIVNEFTAFYFWSARK